MLYIDKLNILFSDAADYLTQLVSLKGKESKHSAQTCLKVTDEDLQFTLSGGRYLTEVGADILIDNEGYTYDLSTLEYEQFFKLVDYLIKKYGNAKK